MANPSVTAVTPFQATGSAGATISPSLSGLTIGNLLVMLVVNNQGTAQVATPTGWAAVTNAANLQNPSGTTSDRGVIAFTKQVVSTTETASLTTTGKYAVVMFEVANTSGVRASSGANTAVTTAGANPTLNTGAGVAINDLIVSFVATMTTGNTFGAGTGYTALPSSAPASTNVSWRAETKTATSGGAQAAAFTNATTTLWSEIVFALAPQTVPVAPGTPTGLVAHAQSLISWTDNANGGAAITDHHIYVYDTAVSGGSLLQTIDTLSALTGGSITGLTDGTSYYVEVTATNSVGESAHSTRSAVIVPAWNISVLQVYSDGVVSGPSATVAWAKAITAGGLLLLQAITVGAVTTTSITDSVNTWTKRGTVLPPDGGELTLWSCENCVARAAGSTVTINLSGTGTVQSRYAELYGAVTWGFDTSATATAPGGSSNSVGLTLTSAAAKEFAWCVWGDNQALVGNLPAGTAGTGWTLETSLVTTGTSPGAGLATEYQLIAAASSTTAATAWTLSGSIGWGAIIAGWTTSGSAFIKAATETVTVTDTPARTFVGTRNDTSTVNVITDLPARIGAFFRNDASTTNILSDTPTGQHGLLRTVADALGVSDALIRVGVFSRQGPETIAPSDTTSRTAARSRTTSDTSTTPDQSNRLIGFIRSGLESLGSSDVVQGLRALLRFSTETETETEAAARQSVLSRQDTETTGTADSPNRLVASIRSILEPVLSLDSVSKILGINRDATETETGSDSATRRSELSREDDESATVQDQSNRLIAMLRSALDTVQTLGSAAANLNHEITNWVVNAAETVLATGLVSRALSLGRTTTETTTGTDAANRQEGLSRTGDETEAISATPSRLQALLRSITETIQATGTAVSDLQHGAVHWVASAAESVGLTDLATRLIAFSRTTPETTLETDTAARQEAISRTDSVLASSRDTDDRQVGFQRSDTEQETASDAPERRHGLLAQVVEATGVTGAVGRSIAILHSVADAIGIQDLVTALVSRFQTRGTIKAEMEAPFRTTGTMNASSLITAEARTTSQITATIEDPTMLTGEMIAPNRLTGTINQ